ncbi:hypothetical protein C8R44DRAFT_755298 [Mycena epipterygia]|nr:hypothetical protein C8R44DRAFT_755298 [Mycena epipterygia]
MGSRKGMEIEHGLQNRIARVRLDRVEHECGLPVIRRRHNGDLLRHHERDGPGLVLSHDAYATEPVAGGLDPGGFGGDDVEDGAVGGDDVHVCTDVHLYSPLSPVVIGGVRVMLHL